MSILFTQTFSVTWADLDGNAHMANTAFLDYAAQTRMLFLASQGFTPQKFQHSALGPVVLEDHVRYRKELRLLEPFSVDLRLGGQSAAGERFILVNTITRHDQIVCAEVRSRVAWFDLKERKMVRPPPDLFAAMNNLERTKEFEDL